MLATVNGPSACTQSKQELYGTSYLKVYFKPLIGPQLAHHKELELMVKQILTQCCDLSHFSRTVLVINIQVLKGMTWMQTHACAVMAVVGALCDAAIPLIFFPLASTAVIRRTKPSEGTTEEKESKSKARIATQKTRSVFLVSACPDSTLIAPEDDSTVLQLQTEGNFRSAEELNGAIELCLNKNRTMSNEIKATLRKYFDQSI